MGQFKPGWYVIYTKPHQERKVLEQLDRAGIASLFPTVRALRKWSDRIKWIDVPLFPSYIFTFLRDLKDFYTGLETNGMIYYIRLGKELATVNETVITDIRMAVSMGDELEVTTDRLLPGQKTFINSGAFSGRHCEVISAKEKAKVIVRVDVLQRNILVTVPRESLVAVAV